MPVKFGLKGHRFDLENLVDAFPDGDPRVTHVRDNYYLETDALTAFLDDFEVIIKAEEMLDQMNGAVVGSGVRHRRVEVDGTYHDGATGYAVATIEVVEPRSRVNAVKISGATPSSTGPTPAQGSMVVAESNPAVAKVLRLLAADPSTPADLYRIYDVIEKASGGSKAVAVLASVSNAAIERFTASMNHPALTGDAARHGEVRGRPPGPEKVMTLDEAKALVRNIAEAWLKSL